jgi:D-alanyl-D-alanine carboxypeptidase
VVSKSGTLKGIRTQAGYIEGGSARPHYFVIFLSGKNPDVNPAIELVKRIVMIDERKNQ